MAPRDKRSTLLRGEGSQRLKGRFDSVSIPVGFRNKPVCIVATQAPVDQGGMIQPETSMDCIVKTNPKTKNMNADGRYELTSFFSVAGDFLKSSPTGLSGDVVYLQT